MHFSDREPEDPVKFICQLYKVTTTRDGGSRVIFDCGAESLKAVQKIQTLNAQGDVNFAVALVPYIGE